MNSVYVIQDQEGNVWSATFEESKAIEICQGKQHHTYRLIPFYSEATTEIITISHQEII